jgi:predicted dehydrogenase
MLGCGLIAQAHGIAARRLAGQVRFTACASRTRGNAEAWAAGFGVGERQVYDDARTLLAHEAVDGVVIATWPADHRQHIEWCLDAGVRFVLCEKALVTRGSDAIALWHRAHGSGAVIVEGFMYRHHPAVQHVLGRVRSGALGRLDGIRATFNMPEQRAAGTAGQSWRRRPEAGGGVLHDFLCYAVDAANWLAAARPTRVSAIGELDAGSGTIDRLYGLVEYANGCIAQVGSSRRGILDQSLEVTGADGQVRLPGAWTIVGETEIGEARSLGFLVREQTTTRIAALATTERLVELPVFTRQLENFAQVIRGQAAPAIALEESVINACVLDALRMAMQRSQAEPVEIPDEVCAARSAHDRGWMQ